MRRDQEMIVRAFPDEITVIPISDVHYGAMGHNEAAWERFCNRVLQEDNTFLILHGDLIENATKHSIGSVYEEIRPREQKERMAEMLRPLSDRVLCCIPGNHEGRGRDNDDCPLYDILCRIGLEDLYRENAAFMALQIGQRTGGTNANQSYKFAVVHGAGGGAMTGGAVNKFERFAQIYENLDCLVVGHVHKGFITRPQKLVIDARNRKVVPRDILVISTTSWMDYGGYALRQMLTPAVSCVPQKLRLTNSSGRQTGYGKHIEVIW